MLVCKQTARKSQPLNQLGGRWGKIDDNAGLHTVRVALNRSRLMQYIVGELPERVKPKCIFISKKATLVRSLRNFGVALKSMRQSEISITIVKLFKYCFLLFVTAEHFQITLVCVRLSANERVDTYKVQRNCSKGKFTL